MEKVLDRECRSTKQKGEPYRNLVTNAESRIITHNERAPKSEPALGALYKGHVPNYKLVWECYSNEYVTPDWELSYGKPQYLMTHDG